jgi:hypothetical protein
MPRTPLIGIICFGFVLTAACGGGPDKKKKPTKPKTGNTKPKVVDKPETEADREKKRLAAALEIVPDGTNCLPATLKPAELAPILEIGVLDGAPVMCAIDTDEGRLLGPVACWTLSLQSGELTYRAPASLPGRSYPVRIDGTCARGFCLPDDVAIPSPPIAHIAWSQGGDKVALAIAGDAPEVHIFGAEDQAHQGVIKPMDAAHADKALPTELTGIVFVGDVVAAVGSPGDGGAPVFLFKTDGTPAGAVERLGGKAKGRVSVTNGSVSVFGENAIALNEDALTTLTTMETATGKRAKLVRKPPKTSCKTKDIEALIAGGDNKASAKCKKDFARHYAPLIGATVVQGKKNHLVLLRGDRYGELAVVDAKTLVENRHFPAAWCPEKADDVAPEPDSEAPASED